MSQMFDLEAYKQELVAAGVAPELVAKIDTGVKPGFMRQDDYSRKQTALQEREKQVQTTYQQLADYEVYVKDLETQYGPREQWSAVFKQQVAAQNPDATGNLSTGLTEVDVQRLLAKQREELMTTFNQQLEIVGQGAATFSEFYYEANEHWKQQYGERLPKDEFKKFFTENGHNNPKVALALFEQPYKEKKRDEEYAAKIEAARQEGAASERSKIGIPEAGSMSAGSWAGGVSIGAASGGNPIGNKTEDTTRDQRVAEFSAGLDKRLAAMNAASGNVTGTK